MSAASASPKIPCGEYTLFHSKAKAGLYELSNLFGTELKLNGVKYSSAEAAFHAMKVDDPSRFGSDGDLLKRELVEEYLTEVKGKPVSFESHFKKNMIGIIAKQVIKYPLLFRFKLLMSPKEKGVFDQDYETWSTSTEVWFPIFKAKFKGILLKLLLDTSGELVEFDRFAKPDTKWGGKIVNGELVGRNIMGKLLTRFRDGTLKKLEKHLKRKRKTDSPIKAIKVTSHGILKKAYKTAKKSGTMVVAEKADVLPAGWDSLNTQEKATYGLSNNFTHLDWMRYIQPELDALEEAEQEVPASPASPSPPSPPAPAPAPAPAPDSPSPPSLSVSAPTSPLKSPAPIKMQVDSDTDSEEEDDGLVKCTVVSLNWSRPSAKGFKRNELRRMSQQLGGQIYKVQGSFKGQGLKGRVLHCPGFVKDPNALLDEIRAIPPPFIDVQMMNPLSGKVCNRSSWKSSLTDDTVSGDVSERKGSEYAFEKMPEAAKVRNKFGILGDLVNIEKLAGLNATCNFYGIKKGTETSVAPGFGPRLDTEENLILCVHLGAPKILCVCPFFGPQLAGARFQIELQPGDLYAFDRCAAGGSSYSGLHIRHWASGGRCDQKYIDSIDAGLHKKFLAKAKKMAEKGKTWDRTEETIQFMESNVATQANIVE